MRRTGNLLLGLTTALAAGPLAAQAPGTFELGAFGRYTKFSDAIVSDATNRLPNEKGFGAGLRFGFFVLKNLSVEADASYTKADAAGGGKVSYVPIHAGLTYSIPLAEKASFLLGARYVRNLYRADAHFSDGGVGALGGFRLGPVRVEATLDYMPKDHPDHGRYSNIGFNAGLSLLLGGCSKSADGVTISPTSATLERGQTASFTATAIRCGKPAAVVWSATGGTITEFGEYTAGQTPGTYAVTAMEPKGEHSSTATVLIKEPPPPPPPPPPPAPLPPPVTITRIDLLPNYARVKVTESVAFTVTGNFSDGSSRALTNCSLTATGNPTQSGSSFSWGRYGAFVVTANCDGQTDRSTVAVPLEIVIYSTVFAFNSDKLTAAGRDTVRMAADSLKKYSEIQVRLAGHADFRGTDVYNCGLSWRRLHSVHHALNAFGIPDERFSAIEGFGEAYPIPDELVSQAWKDINTRTRDRGKWWDRRVDITSAEKPEGMVACADPTVRKP